MINHCILEIAGSVKNKYNNLLFITFVPVENILKYYK